MELTALGHAIARRRQQLDLSQAELAHRARISRVTLNALENQRLGELGFVKLNRTLAALGLTLSLQEAGTQRPTLDQLREENRLD